MNIIEQVKEFVASEIRPFAADFDQNEQLPNELIKKMGSIGLLGACFPLEYGGLDLDPLSYGIVTEEIGKACCSTRSLLTVHTSLVGETILRFGTEKQKNKWLPLMAKGDVIAAFALTEPEIGTDAHSITTTYEISDTDFIINGKKKWITFGNIADIFLVLAANEKQTTCFLVERKFAGISTEPIKGLLANRASHIAEITFNNVHVPKENIIASLGQGFNYVVNYALSAGRYSIAWGGLAIAQEALEAMVKYSKERSQFGDKIYKFQLIQEVIAKAVVKIHAARALCIKVAELRSEGHNEADEETMIAKYFTSKIAMEIATDAVQVHGGNGCYNKYPVERLFREAKILEIVEGTTQVLNLIIAKSALRKYK
jgi:alkylation response protein AidB-like acyl-CoA dehydrogenase